MSGIGCASTNESARVNHHGLVPDEEVHCLYGSYRALNGIDGFLCGMDEVMSFLHRLTVVV